MSGIMSDFIFSLNTVLPVFIIVLVGYYIRRRGTIDENFISMVSNVVFYYALPAGLFLDVAQTDPKKLANPRFVVVTMLGTVAIFALSWFVMDKMSTDKRAVAAAVHSTFRGNYIYVGVPIIQNILGTDNLTCSVLVVVFVLSFYNVLAVLVLSVNDGDRDKLKPKELCIEMLKNPMIVSTLLGIVYAMTGLPMPVVAAKSLGYLKGIASPLALIMIGARMMGNSVKREGRLMRTSLFFKLIFGPLVMTTLAIFMGMNQEEIVTIYVLFGVPSAMNVFIVTKSMGGDDGIAANIIVSSVFLSVITMAIGIFMLRSFGVV